MSELIANESLELKHDVDNATLTISSKTNDLVEADEKKTYKSPLVVAVSNAQKGTCASASGVVSLIGTAKQISSEDIPIMRKGDKGTSTVNGTDTSTGQACSFPITVEIKDAGQDLAEGE